MNRSKITGIVLAAAILLTGCSAPVEETCDTEVTSESSDAAIITEPETSAETTKVLFEYDPHLYSSIIAKEVPQDHWDALYNLIDAVRVGEDTFECASQDAYDWCMLDGVQANLIPAVCLKISGKSNDGSVPYENGVGRIYYKVPSDELVEREAQFEMMVEDILNEWVDNEDNDYEKCLKLYDYMESNYDYQYEDIETAMNEEGYVYTTLMTHTGRCIDFSGVYAFLLLQAGVEAISVGCFDGVDHEWVYAIVNGKGYHIDPTWSLKSSRESDALFLDYFMMSDAVRADTGCPVDDLTVQLLPQYWVSSSSITLPATDDSYYLGQYSVLWELDEENDILYYYDDSNDKCSLNYGDI